MSGDPLEDASLPLLPDDRAELPAARAIDPRHHVDAHAQVFIPIGRELPLRVLWRGTFDRVGIWAHYATVAVLSALFVIPCLDSHAHAGSLGPAVGVFLVMLAAAVWWTIALIRSHVLLSLGWLVHARAVRSPGRRHRTYEIDHEGEPYVLAPWFQAWQEGTQMELLVVANPPRRALALATIGARLGVDGRLEWSTRSHLVRQLFPIAWLVAGGVMMVALS